MKSSSVSDPATKLWAPLAAILLGVCLLIGCSKNAGSGDAAAAGRSPVHPAMRAAPAVTGSTGGLGTLPQGHPPVPGRSPAPAHPPMRGGSPPAPSGGSVSAEEVTAQLARFGMVVKFPEGWKLERGSSMRLATVRLPREEGDSKDGEMSIIPARGTVDANVRRWEGQFKEKPTAQLSTRDVGSLQVTVVEIDGTFTSGGPMMGGGAAASDTKLLGAIVQQTGESEMVFFKAWGPTATMEKWSASFESFVQSIRPSN